MWFFLVVLLPLQSFAGKLRIVATVPDLAAITAEVAGEHARVTALTLPTQDPHYADARPNLALEMSRADAVVLTGLQLEVGWLPTLLTGARNPKVQPGTPGYIDCSLFIPKLQIPGGAIDRSMGDVHPGGNPHYTLDPRRAGEIARGIATRLSALDPEHAPDYASNAQDFAADLDERRQDWESRLSAYQGRPVIQYHRSLTYLEDWVGFRIVQDIEPKPGIPPTPKHIVHVVQAARTHQVNLILQENYYPDRVARTVAQQAGAKVLLLPAQTDFPAGQSYADHIEGLVTMLEAQ